MNAASNIDVHTNILSYLFTYKHLQFREPIITFIILCLTIHFHNQELARFNINMHIMLILYKVKGLFFAIKIQNHISPNYLAHIYDQFE